MHDIPSSSFENYLFYNHVVEFVSLSLTIERMAAALRGVENYDTDIEDMPPLEPLE